MTGVDTRIRPLTGTETKVTGAVAAGVGALGLIGFLNSFAAVREAAEESFGALAWTVPTGIDVGIAVFSALDIVLARLDMRLPWLRLVPWSLTAATVYLNVAHADDIFGIVAHAVGPALWVIAVEVGAHVARVRAGLASGRRMDRIRASRWLLAPVPTLGLWRRMVLWEIRSYPAALARERDRVLALTDLQDAHGRWSWRWRAPRRDRALYRLGELVPADPGPVVLVAPAVPVVPVVDDHLEDQVEDQPQDQAEDQAGQAGQGGQDQAEEDQAEEDQAEEDQAEEDQELRPGTKSELKRIAESYVASCRRTKARTSDRGMVKAAHAEGIALGRARARTLIAEASKPHPVRDAGMARPVVLLALVVGAGFLLGAAPSWTASALLALGALAVPVAAAVVVAVLRIQGRDNAEREARLHWVDVPAAEPAKDRS
jgi:hypothetical protein